MLSSDGSPYICCYKLMKRRTRGVWLLHHHLTLRHARAGLGILSCRSQPSNAEFNALHPLSHDPRRSPSSSDKAISGQSAKNVFYVHPLGCISLRRSSSSRLDIPGCTIALQHHACSPCPMFFLEKPGSFLMSHCDARHAYMGISWYDRC